MSWQFAVAAPSAIDEIMRLETEVFPQDAWSRESMLAELNSPNTYYLICFDPKEKDLLIGYGGLLAPKGFDQADIQTLAVAEDFRGNGIGRALVQQLLTEARRRGAKEVFLEVRADNPVAISLYRSLGFDQIDLRKAYYQPMGVDAIIMRAELQPSSPSLAEGQ